MRYYGIRPKSYKEHIRIEKAATPQRAGQLAFGRGLSGFQYKDLGSRVEVIRSDKRRIALLKDEAGWTDFGARD